jgi:hypothetical protein
MMTEPQGQKPRIDLSLGSTKQVGEFDFAKCFVSMSRDLEPGEDPAAALGQIDRVLSDFLFKHLGAARIPPAEKKQPPPQSRPIIDPALINQIEQLPWTPGHMPGREWILISENEERLAPLLIELQKMDPKTYLTVGDFRYRLEGNFIGRYPIRRKQPAEASQS